MCSHFYRSIFEKNDVAWCHCINLPIAGWLYFWPEVLGGFLAGATVCGVLMGMFQNNALIQTGNPARTMKPMFSE